MTLIENLNRARHLAGMSPLSEAQRATLSEQDSKTLYIVAATRGPDGDGPSIFLQLDDLTDDQVKVIKGASRSDLADALQDLKYNDIDMDDIDEVVVTKIQDTKPPHCDSGTKKPYSWLAHHAALNEKS